MRCSASCGRGGKSAILAIRSHLYLGLSQLDERIVERVACVQIPSAGSQTRVAASTYPTWRNTLSNSVSPRSPLSAHSLLALLFPSVGRQMMGRQSRSTSTRGRRKASDAASLALPEDHTASGTERGRNASRQRNFIR